ncbi:hypothetical protein ACX27_04195 [Nostoc piscinale CENA21]|uniref:Uncharacterized protein n=1 Tax=Nostoc piscinale CENA21 TaxID=224013 RepID=A0A0M4T035_9NOSO|nr:hypothetical protein [Nostoc piscinale]ALF52232.1 hypothetical protein ACX27_04195 [Nostoc piscinale CENA21]
MIHPDELTETQIKEILNDFVTILAFHEGYSLKEEHEMPADDPRMVGWKQTAESLWDAVKGAIA